MGSPYTKQEDEIIIAMNKRGYKPQDIVKVLKSRSSKNIMDRGYDLGLKWTKPPEVDEKLFKEMMK